MATTRKEDIDQLSMEDLQLKIRDDNELMRKMRFNHAISPLDKPSDLRVMRKEIARLKTELRRRQIEVAKA
jgi:large subunit ribosomal protein L29